ncbi:MAG: hypothetical protein R3344_07780 [Acidobacteriota bacterium]|nr:hypothetical protein [Acidobacteriota bacterium]
MARGHVMHKPGEKAPETGTYYCYVCALRGERSTCDMEAGQLFLQCPKCLELKVPEWDMTWKIDKVDGGKRRTSHWPGSLGPTG